MPSKRFIKSYRSILILGGSGFLGQGIYQELLPFYNVHASYYKDHSDYAANQHFHQWDMETESLSFLLQSLKPDLIISALRGDFNAQLHAHAEAISYIRNHECKLIFISSANVFDAFTNYPSYEYDKTFSTSIYGRFKIQIENALLRLPHDKYNIIRLPMVFGAHSPRIEDLKTNYKSKDSIEIFPNVVLNVTTLNKFTQQLHYIINQNLNGVFHLGSIDVVHHGDFITEILEKLTLENPKLTQVYESNDDRYLAILPKEKRLPRHLEIDVEEVIADSIRF